jgi:hypothetical protein
MKAIRMITLAAGPQGVLQPGRVYQVDDALAETLVTARCAVWAAKGEPVEVAAVAPPERAVVQRPQRRPAKG